MDLRVRSAGTLALGICLALAAGCATERSTTPTDVRAPAAAPPPALATTAAAPGVLSVALNPSTVVAGATSTGTVTLTGPAPAGGTAVGVSSNNTAVATVPSPDVTVPAGATSATFTVASHPVASTDFAAISATANQATQTAVLTVTPAGVTAASLTLSPTVVASGGTSTGTVTLSGAAPAGGGGASVALASGDASRATVPPTVTVPAGQSSATFTVTAGTVASASSVSISARYGGVTQFASLVVTEPAPTGNQITALTISPDLVVGGVTTQGTVTIAAAVGTGTTVALSSTDVSVATVPASVTVPAGATSATFAITTLPVTATGFAVISGTSGGVTRSASLTTTTPPTGPFISAVTFFPSSVGGGGPATGEISFDGPATQGGRVSLTSSRPDLVQVPAEVVVSANTSLAAFPVTTSRVGANTAVTITATTCCGVQGTRTGTITVTTAPPPPPDVVKVESAVFKPGGRGGTLTVRATSTSTHAILTVFRDASTEPTFVLTNKGGGRYEGSFSFSGTAPATVTVRSNLGGSATSPVKR